MSDVVLTISVAPNGLVKIAVDGQPVGCIQQLFIDLVAANQGRMRARAYLPDCDLGWANANILKKVPGINVEMEPLK